MVHNHQAMVAAAPTSSTRAASSTEPLAADTPDAHVAGHTARAPHPQLRGADTVEPDCCSTQVAALVSLTADRTDARLLIASVVSLFETIRLEPDASASAGRRRGPPLVTSSGGRPAVRPSHLIPIRA